MKKVKNLNYLVVDLLTNNVKFVLDKGTRSLDITSIYNEIEEIVFEHNQNPQNEEVSEIGLIIGDLKPVATIETKVAGKYGYEESAELKLMLAADSKEIEDHIQYTKNKIKNIKEIKEESDSFTISLVNQLKKDNSIN